MKKIVYSEPADYIPEEIRKKLKLGEYNDDNKPEKKAKKQSSYGQDSKGRYVILNGKRCYTKEDVEEEFKNLTFE